MQFVSLLLQVPVLCFRIFQFKIICSFLINASVISNNETWGCWIEILYPQNVDWSMQSVLRCASPGDPHIKGKEEFKFNLFLKIIVSPFVPMLLYQYLLYMLCKMFHIHNAWFLLLEDQSFEASICSVTITASWRNAFRTTQHFIWQLS